MDPGEQFVCATPAEQQYFPDTTTNYEVGIRSQWLDRRLTVNGAIYHIDWQDPQLASATVNGSQPITKNGTGAETNGFEVSIDAAVTDRLDLSVSFAHTKAELTDVAPSLLRVFVPPGFGPKDAPDDPPIYVDGQPGDRLPGSPEDQGTFNINYSVPLQSQWALDVSYGFSAIGDILTKAGGRADGQTLGGYTTHFASAMMTKDAWTFGVYGTNLLNKFAVTGVRSIPSFVQTVQDENGDPVRVRSYANDVLRPREIGFRFTYSLGR
jgi:outer membrane receptor protein involved in Fe transport